MFNIFKPAAKQVTQNLQKLEFKISGMHCVSCSMNIDGELEDMEGVVSASTSFAKAVCRVEFDPTKVSQKKLVNVIHKLGYQVTQLI